MTVPVPLAVRLKTSRADRFVTNDIVDDLSFRSVVPGGFASMQMRLHRPLALDPDEVRQFGTVTVYDARTAAVVWQGRLEDPGRAVDGAGENWIVQAVGPSAHARDRSQPLVYVDRSVEQFRRTGTTRAGVFTGIEGDSSDTDPPSVKFHVPRGYVAIVSNHGDMEYRGIYNAGMKIARINYRWDSGVSDTNWNHRLITRKDPGGSPTTSRNLDWLTAGGGLSSRVVGTDWADGHNIMSWRIARITSSQTIANDDTWHVYYDFRIHAMRKDATGADITSGYTSETVLASDIVNDLLGRILNKYDGANASVATTTYEIEQLAYSDPVTAADVLGDLMRFHADHYWAAWEDRFTADKAFFEWRAWPTTVRYEASAVDGFDSPASASEIFNEVNVRWRDAQGLIKVNTRTATVDALDAAGLTRTAWIDLSDEAGTTTNADRVGDQFLTEHATAPNAGTLRIRRPTIDHTTSQTVEPFEIRPGHLIRVRSVNPRPDTLNASARDGSTVFRIVGVDYEASSNTATLELDSQPRGFADLMSSGRVRRR